MFGKAKGFLAKTIVIFMLTFLWFNVSRYFPDFPWEALGIISVVSIVFGIFVLLYAVSTNANGLNRGSFAIVLGFFNLTTGFFFLIPSYSPLDKAIKWYWSNSLTVQALKYKMGVSREYFGHGALVALLFLAIPFIVQVIVSKKPFGKKFFDMLFLFLCFMGVPWLLLTFQKALIGFMVLFLFLVIGLNYFLYQVSIVRPLKKLQKRRSGE